jgi:predicted Fe-Mo cluster-binding NifX family protein
MKVCFPVEKDEGMNSTVYGHFGSAPTFVMVDTDNEGMTTVDNKDVNHVHGACNPIQAIGGQAPDAVVVGGIGAGAINGLNARGIQVYGASPGTVRQNVDLFKAGKLPLLTLQHACGGHASGGCGHH